MKYGAIDMGTNSVRLLIAEIDKGKIVNSYKTLETTRIGKKVDKTGEISLESMDRTIEALKKFKLLTKKEGLFSVPVIATSAVRDSRNKQVFMDRVKSEVGMDMEVISGTREAELGFLGVLKGLKDLKQDILVADIGGGSTELILGNNGGIKYRVSLDIGAVRMTEKFIQNDIVTREEIDAAIKCIDNVLEWELTKLKKFSFERLIGIGGTATTLAAVDQAMVAYDQEKIHNYSMNMETVKKTYKKFVRKPLEERKKIPGLQPKRADVIILGTIILIRIMELLGKNTISISEYDNLEGMVFEQIGS